MSTPKTIPLELRLPTIETLNPEGSLQWMND